MVIEISLYCDARLKEHQIKYIEVLQSYTFIFTNSLPCSKVLYYILKITSTRAITKSLISVWNRTQDSYAFYPKLKLSVFLEIPVVLLESQLSLNILCSLDSGSNKSFHKMLHFQVPAVGHWTLRQIAL